MATHEYTSYPCTNYADPHAGVDYCTCNNGATAPVMNATGKNIGANYVPCPYPTAPPLPHVTNAPSPTGGNQLYPFVTTMIDGPVTIVQECQSSYIAHYGGFTEIMCAGDVVTLSAPPSKPSVSVTIGMNKVLVGTLTGTELYTSISNALETLCPTPTSGSTVTVPAGTHTINGIVYQTGESDPDHDGELLVSIDTGVYSDAKIRSAMIQSSAQAFSKSATGSNCWNQTWEHVAYHEASHPEHIPVCNAGNFAGVHYWGSVPFKGPSLPNTGSQWIEPHIGFGIKQGSEFMCDFIEALDAALMIIAPEYALAETEVGVAIQSICDAAEEEG